jgi:ABC-2 type transport system permease protein
VSRKAQERLILLLFTACLVFILADSARFFVRLDLTRNKAYTISPVSKALFRRIPEQVHITYFLSDTLRSLSPVPGWMIDLLQEYAAGSRGKISVAVLDPVREGRADSARRFGVLPQQIQVIQANEQRTVDVFSGIVVEYLNRYTTLPAVFTPDGLEFALSFGIRKLLAGRRLVVGVLVGRTEKIFTRDYESLRTGLSRDYWLREFVPGERVPPEVDVLLVLGGAQMPAADLRPIERYVTDGGKVLFAVKGLEVDTLRSFGAAAVGDSALLDLLESYGARVRREMVLDTSARDYRLPQASGGRISWESLGKYPPWVSIRTPGVSPTHPITASFTGLDLLWPSPLEPVPVAGVEAEALVTASPSAWTMKEPLLIDPFRVPRSGGQASTPGRLILALALSGTFPSRSAAQGAALGTPTGSGTSPSGGTPAAPNAPAARGAPTRVVVIGDDDFASDLMQFSDSLYNVLFVENAVLWLSGNEDLLALKTRAPVDGRLDRIGNPQAKRRLVAAAELVNVAGVPLLVLLFAALRLWRRRGNS